MIRSFPFLSLLTLLGLAVPAAAQPAFQVKDLCTAPTVFRPSLPPFNGSGVEANGLAFFTVDDGVHGLELWRSDGTDAGTFLLRDICPGSCWGTVGGSAALGGALYFLAGAKGLSYSSQLWKTDGTAVGTEQVLSLRVSNLIALPGNRLLLDAYPAQGDGGESLWISDGTAAGTSAFAAVNTAGFLGRAGDVVFFSAYDRHGFELWRTDGTAAGTFLVKDVNQGPDSGVYPIGATPVVAGGRLFFAAWPQGALHAELWVSDGTPGGTYSINRLLPGASWSDPKSLVARGKDVYFLADAGRDVRELWKTDGTAAGTVRLNSNVSTYADEPSLAVAGAAVFFPAFADGWGQELWKTDGTVTGTAPVADIAPGTASGLYPGDAPRFAAVGSKLLIYADDGTHGSEPWVSDGTAAGTFLLADVNPGADTSFPYLGFYGRGTVAAGNWFFGAYTFSTLSQEWALWASDGTVAGTRAVHRLRTQTSSWPLFLDLGGRTLIAADRGDGQGRRLWRTDGSAEGTHEIRSGRRIERLARLGNRALVAGDFLWVTDGTDAGTRRLSSGVVNPFSLVVSTGQAFFFGQDGGLWRTDGTHRGTRRVDPDLKPGSIFFMTVIHGGVAFEADEGTIGGRVWVSDGTPDGTRAVSPELATVWLAPVDDRFFFLAWAPATGYRLWVSDGTQEGTRVVYTLPAPPMSFIESEFPEPVAWHGRIYFMANDGVHGHELWTSDGTRKGTHPVADIFPGPGSPDIQALTAASDRIYFVADDGVHGRELWQSDGTKAGTKMVRDIVPGPGSSFPQSLTVVHHTLFFAATDGEHGLEPWTSDGTEAGTRMLQDVASGPDPSSPSGFTVSGPFVYFSANDGVTGFEPWAVRLP
jgi:ELWxxDGT repeat protein